MWCCVTGVCSSSAPSLAMCEKALAEYLDTKRLAFPRFYFISSADLLDILSNGNNPVEVCREHTHLSTHSSRTLDDCGCVCISVQVSKHLSKLFDSLCNLKFQLDSDGKPIKVALGMYSGENEYVTFDETCDCSGQVST